MTKPTMKRDLAWHENCLRNQQDYLRREREALERKIAEVERMRADTEQYAKQINKAKSEGLSAFDRDKFSKSGGNR